VTRRGEVRIHKLGGEGTSAARYHQRATHLLRETPVLGVPPPDAGECYSVRGRGRGGFVDALLLRWRRRLNSFSTPSEAAQET
jgi:hypothetical protein